MHYTSFAVDCTGKGALLSQLSPCLYNENWLAAKEISRVAWYFLKKVPNASMSFVRQDKVSKPEVT